MTDFTRLSMALESNPALQRRARLAKLAFTVASGEAMAAVSVGDTVTVAAGPASAGAFTLTADDATWSAFSQAEPKVGFQSLIGLQRAGHLRVEGDLLAYGRNLLFLEQLFAALRPARGVAAVPAVGTPTIEPVVGRYLRLDFKGRPHRIYFEEAGQGIPLLCLHTAGADGRQYRALLNDPDITARYRVIVFDLPWHGKSSPPAGFETEPYQLTTDLYVDTVMAVAQALGLDKPVVMGCSIGGRAVVHLALRHGDYFRAAIGLQSATHAEAGADTRLRDLGILFRPDVHGQEAAAGTVACLIAPTAPSADRWETLWHYMQGGPAVFLGDLHYYFGEGDLRNVDLSGLDARCPLYLLSGEYDLSATPELTRALARATGARHCEIMEGLGHFPMSESPEQFRRYLLPVLRDIDPQYSSTMRPSG
ncbi:MAG: alpha/beta hydrolase [Reyranellaceae bacterium]